MSRSGGQSGSSVPSVARANVGVNVKDYGAVGDGVADDTAAFVAALAALPSSGGEMIVPRGGYLVTGFTISKPVTVRGEGHHGGAIGSIPSRIIMNTATGTAVTVSSPGVSFLDIAIVNTSGTTPTAGAGIAVTSGYFFNLTRVSVIGFYDCVTVDNAWLFNFTDCHFHDGVRYYVKLGNSVNTDVGGSVIQGCSFTPLFYARAATAFVRWEAGGGLRFIANKLNGNNNLNPASIVSTPPTNGLDIAVADGVNTIILIIEGNSIELPGGSANACIRVVLAGPSNTGLLSKVRIQGNQFTGGQYGVVVNPAVAARITDVTISDNDFYSCSVAGILANTVNRLTIGKNNHDYAGSGTVLATSIGAAITNLNLAPQAVNGDNLSIVSDASETTAGINVGVLDNVYQRGIVGVTSAVTYTTLYRFTPVDQRGGRIKVTMGGRVAGVGPFSYFAEYLWTRNTAVTLTAVGSVVTAGAAIDVLLDVSVSGEIQVKVRRNSAGGGTSVDGRCDVDVRGPMNSVRKGT